jgi:hypothetical protein
MVKLSSPKIVVSIPRLAAYFVVGCFIMYLVEVSPQQTNNQPLQSQPTSSHQTVLVTPPPAVPLQPAPITTTKATTTTPRSTATSTPHSAQPTPVVTPAPSASVSGLAPVNPTPAPSKPTTPVTSSYTSLNWAGYMATTGNYTAISGSWTVPNASSSTSRGSYDATWIGVGGVTADDLIQVGTDNVVSHSGHVTSEAFYEMLPQSSQTITGLTVTPGDAVSTSLAEVTAGQWKISITDTTTGKSYATTVNYASSHSSAEWIEEDPSNAYSRLLPLDNFTPAVFTNSTTTSKGTSLTLTSSDAEPVTMTTTTGTPIATPSALSTDGQSFTVTKVAG